MKISSIKTIAFCLSFLAMANATGILTGEIETVNRQKRHHHPHSSSDRHHRSHCKIPIPDTTFSELSFRISMALHTQNRGLDVLVGAEAFAPHPIPAIVDYSTQPNTIVVTDPHVAQLIEAVNSTTEFGRNALFEILKAFKIDGEDLTNTLLESLLAAEQYSISITNSLPSAPYLQAWSETATEIADQLDIVLGLKPQSRKSRKLHELNQLIVHYQSNGILGLNELLPPSDLLPEETQSDAAMRFFIMSRQALTDIGNMITDQLLINYNGGHCKICEKL